MFVLKKQLQRTITVLRYFLLDLPVQDLTNSSFPLVQISMNIWEFRKWFSLYNILRDYTYFLKSWSTKMMSVPGHWDTV